MLGGGESMDKEQRGESKSKEALKNAFLQLALEKAVPFITVKEVIALANVSRGTFYKYFANIEELRDAIGERWMDQRILIIRAKMFAAVLKDPFRATLQLYQYFLEATRKGILSLALFCEFKKLCIEVLWHKSDLSYAKSVGVTGFVLDVCYDMACNPASPLYQKPEEGARAVEKFIVSNNRKTGAP